MVAVSIIVGLFIGFIVGFLVKSISGSKLDPDARKQRECDQIRSDFSQYQTQVSTYLAKTADHIDSIQRQCESVQEHIFSTAQTLHREDVSSELQPNARFAKYMNNYDKKVSSDTKKEQKLENQSSDIKQPKDYSDSV